MKSLFQKIVAIAFLVVVVFSCSKKDCCAIIDTNLTIQYVDSNAEDLFKTQSNYNTDDIKIYYKQGGNYKYMHDLSLDEPRHFIVDTSGESTYLTIYTSYYYEGTYSTTLIELNETIIDTIRGEYDFGGSNSVLKKVWYNGELRDGHSFKVVK